MSYDAFAVDATHFYNYSELRGLVKATKGSAGTWKKVVGINEELKGLKGVSMVIHKDKLLVRHSGITEYPFVVFDKETLKAVEDVKYTLPAVDDETKLKRLDWSNEKLPREDEEESEEEVDESVVPRRLMGATPLASDGDKIYALSMNAKREKKDGPLCYPKLSIEVFEIGEDNEVKRVKEVTLKKNDDSEWSYKAKKYDSDLGYFNHAQTACNGRVFVLNLPHRTYFFKVDGGVRFKQSEVRSEAGDHIQLVYDSSTNQFYGFQLNRFRGVQTKIKIKGFERRKSEKEVEALKPPQVLKEAKEKMGSEIEEATKEWKEPEKINIYAQLIDGQPDFSQVLTQHTANLAKMGTSKVRELHEVSQAIILTTMAQKADQFDVELDKLGQNTVVGESLTKYFRKDYCIYLTKTMFQNLKTVV